MKRTVFALLAVALILGALVPPVASAHFRSHSGFRAHVFIGPHWGPGWWGPYWYPPPAVYAAPPVVVREDPPVYIQREPSYWYYCESARAYYPYVQQCPAGWLKVVPPAQPGQ